MHDGIEFEKLGIPGVAIATDVFKPGLDQLASMRGMPNYPYAIVPHPIGVLEGEELRARAQEAAPQVAEIVLSYKDRPAPKAAGSKVAEKR